MTYKTTELFETNPKRKFTKSLRIPEVVHVTEDHSLFDENIEKITPKELKIGSKLLVTKLPIPEV